MPLCTWRCSFLIAGGARLTQEAFKHVADKEQKTLFVLSAFAVAGMALFNMLLKRRKIPKIREVVTDACIGLANSLQTLFMLLALDRYAGFIVFPVTSAGGVIVSTVVAVWLLGECLARASYVGIDLASIALLLLQGVA